MKEQVVLRLMLPNTNVKIVSYWKLLWNLMCAALKTTKIFSAFLKNRICAIMFFFLIYVHIYSVTLHKPLRPKTLCTLSPKPFLACVLGCQHRKTDQTSPCFCPCKSNILIFQRKAIAVEKYYTIASFIKLSLKCILDGNSADSLW